MPGRFSVLLRVGLGGLIGLMLVGLLAGCGFRLRGEASLPFSTISLSASEATTFGSALRRAIIAGTSTKVVDNPADAEVRFDVLSETREQEILTIDGSGQVVEYTLWYRFRFRLHDGKGREFIEPTTISLKRTITVNSNTQLANDPEVTQLYRDMQQDMAQQIIRRLEAVHPDVKKPT